MLSFLFIIVLTNLSHNMKDNKLLAYYTILFLYLIVAFFLNTNLRIMVNVLFCLFSAFFYYNSQKKELNTQDIYFIIFLNFVAIGCLVPVWRYLQIGLAIEMLISIFSLTFLLLGIKSKNHYLFLGKKWVLLLGVILILLSILYFTNSFLPYINDLNAPLSVVVVFLLAFIFIITLIRTVNDKNYLLLFIGICFVIASCVVAGVSIYHSTLALNNFWEDALTIVGICFLTSGMLKVAIHKQSSSIDNQRAAHLSLSYFLKKIF